MADPNPEGTSEIESLLADRRRLQEWLERLDDAGNRAPENVRRRVRADYEGRLAEVVARLGGFTTTLMASLETLRQEQGALTTSKVEVEEARAEAELRHAVGEFSEEEWSRLQEETGSRIASLGADLGRVGDEIARLEDVLAQVAPPEPEPAPRRTGARRPIRLPGDDIDVEVLDQEDVTLVPKGSTGDADIVVEPEEDPARELAGDMGTPVPPRSVSVEAPRFTPKETPVPRPRERPAARTLRFPTAPTPDAGSSPVDEMTFLKSVTLDSAGARERQASSLRTSTPTAAGAKTLKCADCGAANRPTEWYCEKCGAELAAL